jgi:alpha-maltose-1-phosphate synthase
MKILIAVENASAKFGGEAVLPLHYFRYLTMRGIDVRMIVHERCREELEQCLGSSIDKVYFISDGVTMRVLDKISNTLPSRMAAVTSTALLGLITQMMQRRLAKKLIRQYNIDIIHQPIPVSPKLPSLFFALDARVIIGPMNGGMRFPAGYRYLQASGEAALTWSVRMASHLINILIPGKLFADRLLVANERTRRALPAFHLGRSQLLVENGVDLTVFKHKHQRHIRSRENRVGALKLVYLGRLVDLKGVDILIEAVVGIQSEFNLELHIVGDGVERASCELHAYNSGIADYVFFHGRIDQENCPDVLSSMDALVLPSLCECGGAVVLEAMSLGLPVIATKWGGPVDYIDDSCGILVDPAGGRAVFIQRLSEAIARLAKNPELRRSLGDSGIKRVEEKFDWEKKIDAVINIYQGVLGDRAGILER